MTRPLLTLPLVFALILLTLVLLNAGRCPEPGVDDYNVQEMQ